MSNEESTVLAARGHCLHCGTPVASDEKHVGFCCSGCEFVYKLIHDEGLDRFYDIKGGETLPPVRGRVFDEGDFSWLEEKLLKVEDSSSGGICQFVAQVDGLTCVGCVWLIDRLAERMDGVLPPEVLVSTGEITLRWDKGDKAKVLGFCSELLKFGYRVLPNNGRKKGSPELRDLQIRTGLCGALALNSMAFTLPRYLGMPEDFFLARIFDWIAVLSATLAFLAGGSFFFRRAWSAFRMGTLHMDVPIAIGVIVAYVGSMVGWLLGKSELYYFDFVSIFLFLMLGGRWVQLAAVNRQRKEAERQSLRPDSVVSSTGESVDCSELVAGDAFEVRSGNVVPVASVLLDEGAVCSLEWITGEAEPRSWQRGGDLPAGAIFLGKGLLRVEASEDWEGSMLERIAASHAPPPRNQALERTLKVYVIVVVVLALLGSGAWLVSGAGVVAALQVFVSVMVVSCPCALGVALPLADDLAKAKSHSIGVFIRRENFWARLAEVTAIFFDKTGTLTMELPVLRDPTVVDELDDEAGFALSVLTAGRLHPVARSLRDAMGSRGQLMRDKGAREQSRDVVDFTGIGVEWTNDGVVWRLGRPEWAAGASDVDGIDAMLTRDGVEVADFVFGDGVRPQSVEAIQQLKSLGLKLSMVSGDREEKVRMLGEKLSLPEDCLFSGMLPEEKASLVRSARSAGETVMFVGDGANDSLACTEADLSGTVVADRSTLVDRTDFSVLGNGMGFVTDLLAIGNVRARAVRGAFLFAAVYNVAAVGLALAGMMHPLLAAVLMPLGSALSLLVVVTAFRSGALRGVA